MPLIRIQLNKYDNQAGKYNEFQVFEMEYSAIKSKLFELGYTPGTKTFYQYVLTGFNNEAIKEPVEIYSLSPALFDHLETAKI